MAILLIRTDMSGLPISNPKVVYSRSDYPAQNSNYSGYKHIVNHSFSPDNKHSLFSGIVHAIYTISMNE